MRIICFTLFFFYVFNYNSNILPCKICGAKAYVHKAINDLENPRYTVDCTIYDKKGAKHKRVGNYWSYCEKDAILNWNNNR